jgi:hypothetical protein
VFTEPGYQGEANHATEEAEAERQKTKEEKPQKTIAGKHAPRGTPTNCHRLGRRGRSICSVVHPKTPESEKRGVALLARPTSAVIWELLKHYVNDVQARIARATEELEGKNTAETARIVMSAASEGCLEAGFWIYCSGKHNGKWGNGRAVINTPLVKEGLSTGIRVGAGLSGSVMVVVGRGRRLLVP